MHKMKESSTRKTYDVWGFFYDYTFGPLVTKRQRRAVTQLRAQPGDRVLDIGVGTGILLPMYPREVMVVGMDLSRGMLKKAAERRDELGLAHCHLVQTDAMLPPFADGCFDHIMITHVISVVSDPNALLRWAGRLLKPGGRIIVLNHFQSSSRLVAFFERLLNPVFVKIGWRSDLALEDALRGSGLEVDYVFQMRHADLWKIAVLRHPRQASQPLRGGMPSPDPGHDTDARRLAPAGS